MALAATSDVFTDDDCANKILPGLCPSLIDKERCVCPLPAYPPR
jgi:SCY1-like protein 1